MSIPVLLPQNIIVCSYKWMLLLQTTSSGHSLQVVTPVVTASCTSIVQDKPSFVSISIQFQSLEIQWQGIEYSACMDQRKTDDQVWICWHCWETKVCFLRLHIATYKSGLQLKLFVVTAACARHCPMLHAENSSVVWQWQAACWSEICIVVRCNIEHTS